MERIVKKYAIVAGLAVILSGLCPLSNAKELKVGDKAPHFSLIDQNGQVHTLEQYKGKKVALYFYPKEGTPGCTAQACSVRDSFADLEQEGIAVLGLSSGSLKNKKAFTKKYHLSFPLLETTKSVLENYGVKGFFFVTRRTFLINEDGIIVAIIKDSIDTKNHAQQIIKFFKATKAIDKKVEQKQDTAVIYLHEQEPVRSAGRSVLERTIKNRNSIIIFYEDWCGPCKRMTPILEELAQETQDDIVFIKVKRELYRDIFDTFHKHYKLNGKQAIEKLTSVPTILFFRDGILVKRSLSATKDEMIKLIQEIYYH